MRQYHDFGIGRDGNDGFREDVRSLGTAEMESLTEEAMLACRPITSGAYRQVFPKAGPVLGNTWR